MLDMIPYHVAKSNKRKIDHLKNRVIVFVIPDVPNLGNQKNEIRFPFSGKIVDVFASCGTPGESNTTMKLEKISLNDLDGSNQNGWVESVSDIVIESTRKTNSNHPITLVNNNVDKNDYFRVVIDTVGIGLSDLTVEVVIEIEI